LITGVSAAGLFSWMDVVEESDKLGIGEYKSSDLVHRHYWVESAIMAEGVSGDKPIFTNVLEMGVASQPSPLFHIVCIYLVKRRRSD
jgi:hypothetical protein